MTSAQQTESTATISPRRLIDAKQLGKLLGCSERHVYRMADEGLLPWGTKLGRLRRWDLSEIEEWIAAGCPLTQRATP